MRCVLKGYKARYYDPAIGRFLTPDPAGYIDSPNLYAYVLNDPINFTDPSGLDCEVITGSRIPRCDSELTSSATIVDDASRGGGGGGGGDPCAGVPADYICVPGRRMPRMPFDPGGASTILLSDPIFGRGPGPRMPFPTDIGPGPEPGMMQPEMTSPETCMFLAETAGSAIGGLVGLVATGVLVASAPATATGAAVLLGASLGAGAIAGTIGYFAAGGSGLFVGSQVGQGALVIGRNAILSSVRAAAAFGASSGGGAVLALATAAAGGFAGNLLGQRFCPRT